MRRDADTPNGMTEFLLTRTIMQLDDLGYSRLSMNSLRVNQSKPTISSE